MPRRSTFRGAQRRQTAWGVGPSTGGTSGGAQSTGASGQILFTNGILPSVEGVTLIRTRGELLIRLSTAAAVNDGFHGAFGIGLAKGTAFTAGVGSVPMPIAEEEGEDWIYHRFFSLLAQDANVTNGGGAMSAVLRIEVDSKAMRKFGTDDALYGALEVTEVGAATVNINFNSRVLVKLP